MARESPNSRSKKFLEAREYEVDVVERRLGSFVTKDLFGFIDLVAMRSGTPGLLGIQVTTVDHSADRVAKAKNLDNLKLWLRVGNRFEVHGWAQYVVKGKKRKVWKCRRVRVRAGQGGGWLEDVVLPEST